MNALLSTDGKLTSASAQHLRNLAQAKIEDLQSQLNDITFVNEYVSLIGHNERNQTKKGCSDLSFIDDFIKKIAIYTDFVTWINEAIKLKEELFKENKNLSLKKYCSEKEIAYPVHPETYISLTEEAYLNNLPIKERFNYFHYQTLASVIGKFIHKSRPFDVALNKLQESLSNPINACINGQNTILTSKEPSISLEKVQQLYFQLQKEHREAQAQLNSMKNIMDKIIRENEIQKNTAYSNEIQQYNARMEELLLEKEKYQQERNKEIQSLKITIPNYLLPVYEELTNLGKI